MEVDTKITFFPSHFKNETMMWKRHWYVVHSKPSRKKMCYQTCQVKSIQTNMLELSCRFYVNVRSFHIQICSSNELCALHKLFFSEVKHFLPIIFLSGCGSSGAASLCASVSLIFSISVLTPSLQLVNLLVQRPTQTFYPDCPSGRTDGASI